MKRKVVLITGCSSGFGLLLSKLLSINKDFIVCSSMRNLAKKQDLLNAIKNVNGKIDLFEIDVTKPDIIKNTLKCIDEKYGKIDILVNNAGYALGGFFEDSTDEEYREQLETNFFGTLNVIREVLPIMHKNCSGKIINISSIGGLISYPGLSAYNSSKWAIDGFSESLRHELYSFGIKVYLIEPGSFNTKIFGDNAKLVKNYDNKQSKYYNLTKAIIKDRISNYSKNRGNPEKVVKKIMSIIEGKNENFRNIIGSDAKVSYLLKRLLPFKIFEKLVRYFVYISSN